MPGIGSTKIGIPWQKAPLGLPASLLNKFLFLWTGKYDGDNLLSDLYSANPTINYGYLYNWWAATDVRGIAPVGYHVPTRAEFDTLSTYLGGNSVSGAKLKEAGTKRWSLANGTNTSGFTAVGSATRSSDGSFTLSTLTTLCRYWISEEYNVTNAYFRSLFTNLNSFNESLSSKLLGLSIRCIRDNDVGWAEGEQVSDFDSNVYDTVRIGTQIWLVQNLATTHYNNGDAISNVTDNTAWSLLATEAYCAFNHNPSIVFTSMSKAQSVITVTNKDWSTKFIPDGTAATFSVPDIHVYKSADEQELLGPIGVFWFNGAGVLQQKTHADLIISDTYRTYIKYSDFSPYDISAIGILKPEVLAPTDEDLVTLNKFFKLWFLYWGAAMDSGYMKDNRTLP